jgi:hypothetical protein
MEPKQMALKPFQKEKAYQLQSLRKPQPNQHQNHYGPDHALVDTCRVQQARILCLKICF